MAEFILSLCVSLGGMLIYVGVFTVIRESGMADEIACPWPYENVQVYDPDGLYAAHCPVSVEKSGVR